MHSSLKLIPFLLLFIPSKLHAQNCDADQAAFKQVSDKLSAARAGIKKNEADLAYMRKVTDNTIDERNRAQSALELVEKDSYKAKAINAAVNEFNRKIAEFKKREAALQSELKYYRREEPILLNSFHLIRDRLDKNCGGVKKEQPKTSIPDVSGTYNSSYGKTILTQSKGEPAPLTGVVYYDTGGTSTLRGTFNGTTWTFTWRNSFNHHGTGAMTYAADGSFTGWWIDKFKQPYEKGNWWLRPK